MRLSISLLGSFQVMLDGNAITQFGYDKVRALLAYLAVEANRPLRREQSKRSCGKTNRLPPPITA